MMMHPSTRERLLNQTRYSDDFLARPRNKFSSSRRTSSSPIEQPYIHVHVDRSEDLDVGGTNDEPVKDEASEESSVSLQSIEESKSLQTESITEMFGIEESSQSFTTSESKKRKKSETGETDGDQLQLVHNTLKIEKSIRKAEKDLQFVEQIDNKTPDTDNAPLSFLRKLLAIRLNHELLVQSYLDSMQQMKDDEEKRNRIKKMKKKKNKKKNSRKTRSSSRK
jgi:hypothetical protein